MTHRSWRVAGWGLALVAGAGGVALVAALRVPLAAAQRTATVRPDAGAPAVGTPDPPLDTLVASRSLFRIARAPAPRPFDPSGAVADTPPPEPRPALQLVGVILGVPRAALIRGIPGHDAVQVLAEGDALGELRLLTIAHQAVTLRWRSDTLRLALPTEGS